MEEKAWRATEPHTPSPMKRMEAVAALNRAGIPCGILIAPLMPGINDSPEQVARIIELAGEAGAVDIGGIALHRAVWRLPPQGPRQRASNPLSLAQHRLQRDLLHATSFSFRDTRLQGLLHSGAGFEPATFGL